MKAKIRKMVSNSLARDILKVFYENQGSIDSIGGVSAWVHSDRDKVRDILDEFVRLGVLNEDSTGGTKGYCYTRDKKIMKVVKDLLEKERV